MAGAVGGAEALFREIVALVEDIVAEPGQEGGAPIGRDTLLVQDLGFTSVNLVELVDLLQKRFELPNAAVEELLTLDGGPDDLSVGEVAAFVGRHLGG